MVAVLSWLAGLVAMVVVDRRLSELGRADLHQLGGSGLVFAFAAGSAALVGAVLLLRQPAHPVGWCLAVLAAAIAVTGACQGYGLLGLVADPRGRHPGASSAAVLASSLFVLYLITIALVCYLTPSGHHLSERWAWCARVMWVSGGIWFMTVLLTPAELEAPFRAIQNPWGISGLTPVLAPVRVLAGGVNNVLVLLSFVSLVVRFRRAVGDERRQLLWLGIALVPVPLLVAVGTVAARTHDDVVVNLSAGGFVAVLPLAVGLAVAKTRLYDVERVLSRALSYVALSLVLAGTYAAVVLLVNHAVRGAAGGSTVAVALAALAVASLAKPVHHALQDAVDRRFSRRRYDALRIVRGHVASPDPAVTIEQVLSEAMHAPDLRVAYWVQDREAWVTGGGVTAAPLPDAFVVTRAERPVARVSVPDLEPDFVRAVLHEAEPELESAGLRAAVALQLEEVRASRSRLATAQLDERRRVERDLHDGSQQRLLALAAQLQAALLNGRTERLREALETGVRETQAAVRELRELANGLHPSALADGGLTAALDDLAGRHRVQVHVIEPARRYPPRIEATAWFVACEAVSNAVKHAGAAHIDLWVEAAGGQLRVQVADDGLGGADPGGTGLRGLADRAEAVGGTLAVRTRQPSGTTVTAVLPCE